MCKIVFCQSTNDSYLFLYRRHCFPRFAARSADLVCTSYKMVSLNPHLEMKILQHFLLLHVASILRSNSLLDICLFQHTTFPNCHICTLCYNHRVNNTDLQRFEAMKVKFINRVYQQNIFMCNMVGGMNILYEI